MRRLRVALAVSAILCGVASEKPVCGAPAGFDEGVKAYNARQYSGALAKFQQAAKVAPTDSLTHYYMGLCYQCTNQFSLAKQQYEYVAGTTRDAAIKARCDQAIASLSRYQSQKITGSGYPASTYGGGGGGGIRAVGRLRVIEFYADW